MPRRPGLPGIPAPAPHLPPVHHAGRYRRAVVVENVQSGRWLQVRHGVYVTAPDDADRFARERQLALARIAAVAARTDRRFVLSHESAALLWGLPLLRPPGTVHLICPWSSGGRAPAGLTRHVLPLADDDVVSRSGLLVTSLERTVVDCATSMGAAAGLVVADAALHVGADRAQCRRELARRAGRRGVARARSVIDAADDGAESAGETLARLAMLRLGIHPPVTQFEVVTHLGTFWSDLGWPEWDVVAEYDGVAKYGGAGAAADAVIREKRREDAVVESGTRVVRLVKEDLRRSDRLARRMRRVLPEDAFGHRIDPWLMP